MIAPTAAHASGPSAAKRRGSTSARSSRRTAPKITIAMPATSEGTSGRRLPTCATDAGVVAGRVVDDVVGGEAGGILVGHVEPPHADVAVEDDPGRAGQGLARVLPVDVQAVRAAPEH